MNTKDLIQTLITNLERDAAFSSENITVHSAVEGKSATALVEVFVEGKVRVMEVQAKELGTFKPLTID
jgi:DNA-binding protein YbaB